MWYFHILEYYLAILTTKRTDYWFKSYDKPRQHIKKQRHYFANKGPSSQRYGFSSSHEWMWKLDHKESWVLKNWCFWTVVLEKTLETPLDCKEIQPVHPKGNQSWIFIGRTDAEAEAPILGHLMWRADSLGKILMLGKIKGRRRGDNRGWHGWMASLTGWTWVCTSSRSWWWTGKPGVLQSMGLQRVEHDLTTELNWIDSHHNMDKSQNNYAERCQAKKKVLLYNPIYIILENGKTNI